MNDASTSLRSPALPPDVRVLSFSGSEAISRPYRFDVRFLAPGTFEPEPAIGADATLEIPAEEGEEPLVFHGVLAELEIETDLADGAVVRAALVPRLARLARHLKSRVFVGWTVPAIVEETFRESGLEPGDWVLRLTAKYLPFEHVCRYRESALDFVGRWMEREGIYYFFEQAADKERVVVTDDRATQQRFAAGAVHHRDVMSGGDVVAGFRAFVARHTTVEGKVHVRGHDYLRPKLELSASADVPGGGHGVRRLHGEVLRSPADAQRIAKVRAEELACRRVRYVGTGNARTLRAGTTFALEDHPRRGLDGEYLAVEVEHQLGGGDAAAGAERHYESRVVAIPAAIQFRPGQVSPVPRVHAIESAVVDGELEGGVAQLDAHGRYLVRFDFDDGDAGAGKASARIRMMQPYGGTPEGFHFPLRKGTEVMVAFEGGDPDRPVITGAAPTALTPSPVTTANATRSIVQTASGNRIQMEDAEGRSHVRIFSPHLRSLLHIGAPNGGHNFYSTTNGYGLAVTGKDSETGVGGTRLTVIGDAAYTPDVGTARDVMDETLYYEALSIARLVEADGNTVSSESPDSVSVVAVLTSGSNKLTLTQGVSVSGTTVKSKGPMQSQASGVLPDVTSATVAIGTDGNTATLTVTFSDGSSGAATVPIAVDSMGHVSLGTTPSTTTGDATGSGSSFSFTNTGATTTITAAVQVQVTTQGFEGLNLAPTITLQGQSATPPTDPDDRTEYRTGSDIKFVGGDNVTKTTHDNVSVVLENSVSHVHGHAFSVIGQPRTWVPPAMPVDVNPAKFARVFGGVSTEVFSKAATRAGDTADPDFHLDVPDEATAQTTALHGNQFSWVHGSQQTHITGGKTTTIDGHVTSTVGAGQSSTINGKQESTVNGDQSSTVNGMKTSFVAGSQFSAVLPIHLTADLVKLAIYGMQVSIGMTNQSIAAVAVSTVGLAVKNHQTDVSDHATKVALSILTLFV
ncbi:MAG TPA: type VI secretion system tip protein TssI/VgrG [Minicystis sp.]|nr:type VI secretion system tip protein TssI/VgrG [Minicystis sp.]